MQKNLMNSSSITAATASPPRLTFYPNETTMVLYHRNCWDGFVGAYAAWLYNNMMPANTQRQIKFIPITHSDHAPENLQWHNVLMIDVTLSLEEMHRIVKQSKSFWLIDHHQSALLTVGQDPIISKHCHIDLSKSACRLAWQFFFGEHSYIPEFVLWVEQRDLGQLPLYARNEIKLLQQDQKQSTSAFSSSSFFIDSEQQVRRQSRWIAKCVTNTLYKYGTFTWSLCEQLRTNSNGIFEQYISKGVEIEYETYEQAKKIAKFAQLISFANKTNICCAVINSNLYQAEVAQYLLFCQPSSTHHKKKQQQQIDMVAVWWCDGKRQENDSKVVVMLRARDPAVVDVMSIAMNYDGGGGHLAAASFSCSLKTFTRDFLDQQQFLLKQSSSTTLSNTSFTEE